MADVTVDSQSSNPDELVNLGIKAYILRDYNAAVAALSRATELMVAECGEKHDSLGNVYLHYGKALLEVSREEAEPLGDAVTRELNSDSEEEASTNENAASDNGAEPKKPEEEVEKPKEGEMNGSDKNKPDSDVPPHTKSSEDLKDKLVIDAENGEVKSKEGSSSDEPSSSGTVTEKKTPEDDENTEEKIEEEPTDLQLAWEILELAKLIFEQRADVGKKELAETLVTLGEVSMESENFESAIADIKQGLEIQKQILKPDSRNLAETYYKLAVALSTNNQIDEAIENFNTSLNVLNSRINKLKQNEEQEKDEIKEIESLIPEIEEKIADMKSFKEEAANKLASAFAMKQPFLDPKSEASSSGKQASDISHLVKRKRKIDDVAEESEESPAKK